jgi:hypothetical protein
MAIKGKSKPKARRAVTPGPRPVYVPVKRPIPQRRGFQVGALVVVAVLALGAIGYGFVHERNANHAAAQQALLRRIASAYTTEAQTALSPVGQAQAVSFTLLPELKAQIDALRSGSAKPADVAKQGASLRKQANGAAGDIASIDPAKMIEGKGVENPVFVSNLIDASDKMESALRIDAVAAGILREAALAHGDQARRLLDRADETRKTAETLFASGYSDWVSAQITAKTFQPASVPGAGSGLPAGS